MDNPFCEISLFLTYPASLKPPSADDLSSIIDTGNKLLDFNIEVYRLQHLPDQPAHNPVERAIHPSTSFLDLALRETQSKTCYWPDLSTLGISATYRSGDSAGQFSWSKVGTICNYVSACRLSLCSCHARSVRTARDPALRSWLTRLQLPSPAETQLLLELEPSDHPYITWLSRRPISSPHRQVSAVPPSLTAI